jgi:WD40 repeat protein
MIRTWLIVVCACGAAAPLPRPLPENPQAVAPTVDGDVRLIPDIGHQATVSALATTPDGRYIATVALDRIVRVIRADGMREIARFYRPGMHAMRIALADDGMRVAAAFGDATFVYDVRSGAVLGRIPTTPSASERALGITSDSCFVFDGADLLVWRYGLARWRAGDSVTQRYASRYKCNDMGFVGSRMLVITSGRTVIYGDVETEQWSVGPQIDGFRPALGRGVIAWSGKSGVQTWRVGDATTKPLASAAPFSNVVFVADGSAILHVDRGQTTRIDVATGAVGAFGSHDHVAPLGPSKVIGAKDNDLCVLDAAGTSKNCLASTTGAVRSLAVSDAGELLVSAADAPIRRWSTAGMKVDASVSTPGWEGVAAVSVSVVARVGDGMLTVRAGGVEGSRNHQNRAAYSGIAVSPNGALVATIFQQDLIRFHVDDDRRHDTIPNVVPKQSQARPYGYQFSPDAWVSRHHWAAWLYRRMAYRDDAAVLAITADDKIVLVRDDRVVATLGHSGAPVTAIAFRPNSTELVAGFGDGAVVSWNSDAPTAPIRERTSPAAVAALAFDAGGTALLVADDSAQIRLFPVDDNDPSLTIDTHRTTALALVFLANGRIASGHVDGGVRIWKLATKELRGELYPLPGSDWLVVSGEHFETGSKTDAHVYGVRAGEVVSVAGRRRSGLLRAALADR